jgi:tetratricopeptide (TPR) repeat protein
MPHPGDTAKALATDLSAALGVPVEPRNIPSAVSELRYQRAASALSVIQKTSVISPADSETVHAIARLLIELSAMDESRGRPSDARASADAAEKLALDYCHSNPSRPAQLAWLGMVRRSRYELDRNPAHLADAVDAWVAAAALAPHEPLYAAQLARANALLSRREEAANWAQRALDINQELYLDPLRQFNNADLAELTALAKPAELPAGPSSGPP